MSNPKFQKMVERYKILKGLSKIKLIINEMI